MTTGSQHATSRRHQTADRPRCEGCRHLLSLHLLTGCHCGCRTRRPDPPRPTVEVPTDDIGRLSVMAGLAQRGVAAAELLATAPGAADWRTFEDVRRGYTAAVDLLRALEALLRTGRVPDPIRRWTLGVPDQVTRPRDRPRG